MSIRIQPIFTIADLEAMPDDGNRYELMEGEIYVSRAPSLTHQRVLRNLIGVFQIYLSRHRNRIGEVVPGPGVVFDEHNGVIPDLVFISRERGPEIVSGERLIGAPDMAVEILSPGAENKRRDRNIKRRVYAKFGVKEYWVIDPEKRSVDIYCLNKGKSAPSTTLCERDQITSSILPEFSCKVARLFEY